MAINKRPEWDEGSAFKASHGKVYIVLELSERTVTVMRVAWMLDKDDHFTSTVATEHGRRWDLYSQQKAKYTQELKRHRAPLRRQGTHAAEYVVLSDGSILRSTSRLGPTALERLEDAAGVIRFRFVRATFHGPITSPLDALLRKFNEYSPISSEDPGNPKLRVLSVMVRSSQLRHSMAAIRSSLRGHRSNALDLAAHQVLLVGSSLDCVRTATLSPDSGRFRPHSCVRQLTTLRQLPASALVTIPAVPKGGCLSPAQRWLVRPLQTT